MLCRIWNKRTNKYEDENNVQYIFNDTMSNKFMLEISTSTTTHKRKEYDTKYYDLEFIHQND